MEKHHHTIAILSLLCAILVGIVAGWIFFTLKDMPATVVMDEDAIVTVAPREVYINGKPLTEANPLAEGNYWYDAVSGLYGKMGEPAFGVMPTGYDAPTMAGDVSGGTTGVLINGREIPEIERTRYEQEFGETLPIGSYTLDASGGLWKDDQLLTTLTLGLARQSESLQVPEYNQDQESSL